MTFTSLDIHREEMSEMNRGTGEQIPPAGVADIMVALVWRIICQREAAGETADA